MTSGARDTCSHHWDMHAENPVCRCGLAWEDSGYAEYGKDALT